MSSWTPITDGLGFGATESRYHGVESIAVDPNNDQLVYMATGMYTFEGNGRLYISSDRGDHWTHVALPFALGGNNPGRAIGERLVVDPNKPSTLFHGSRTAGLWKSADSGLTWAQVTSLSAVTMTQDQIDAVGGSAMGVGVVVVDTGTKGSGTATPSLYAAIAPDYVNAAGLASNLYKSTDGGASWSPVSTPVSGYHIRTWCAPQTACSMVFTRTLGRAPPARRALQVRRPNWTFLSTRPGDELRPRRRVRLRHRREHPHRAGRDQLLGQLQRPARCPAV
jgi:hypothetical protein